MNKNSDTCAQKSWLGLDADWVTIIRIWLGNMSHSRLNIGLYCPFCQAKCAVICFNNHLTRVERNIMAMMSLKAIHGPSTLR